MLRTRFVRGLAFRLELTVASTTLRGIHGRATGL